jgi:uncharacterized coiled-coil protein SlyX
VIREEDQDFPWTLLQDAARQGAALMKKEQDTFNDAIHAAEILVAELKAQLDKATVNLERVNPSRQDSNASRTSKREKPEGRLNAVEDK